MEYTIELLKLDDDTLVVDFKKQAGNSFEFQEKVSKIKEVIQSIW